ncbi:uncharacterized protein LOC113308785 [Papaver somniferum]|uniref:uncharacterized protein LOC113308785 n=1 Tax=Papaver somniferum TaxID=3469 RepID=UPI000E6FF7DB|nr:uncharacterized protein LOC113308785 [Papaver somniferum]
MKKVNQMKKRLKPEEDYLKLEKLSLLLHTKNRIKIQLEPRDNNDKSTNVVRGKSNGNDENVVCCSICMNPYSSLGDHQVSCLPCGHLYGFSCIQRWIKHSKQRCSQRPICKQMCEMKDVVKLYVSWLPVVDRVKHENSVSFQPRDDLYKVHFAKYKEELADIKREVMENTKCCERIERTSMQDEYVEEMRKSYEQHLCEVEKQLNETRKDLQMIEELGQRVASMNRELEEQERKIKEQKKEIQEIRRDAVETISCLRRKLKQQKNELKAKDMEIKQLTKAMKEAYHKPEKQKTGKWSCW